MVERSRIFISYSHRDAERADFLCEALRARGHEIFIDREGIFEAEHINARIREMIQASDTVLLVLGPNWIASPACRMEMHVALDLNKRILPAAFEDVGAALPAEIKEINYVRFYGPEGADWQGAAERLDRALARDISWVRDHTRYGELAARFIAGAGRPPSGRELREMRGWIERQPRSAPRPSAEHWRYFKAGMSRRKWGQITSAVLLTLSICAGMVGAYIWVGARHCDDLRDQISAADPENAPIRTIRNILPLADRRFCADHADWLDLLDRLNMASQFQRLRAAIALEAEAPGIADFHPESGQIMADGPGGGVMIFDALTGESLAEGPPPMRAALPGTAGQAAPEAVQWRSDQGHVITVNGREAQVYDAANAVPIGYPFRGEAAITAVAFSPEGGILALADETDRLHLHSLASGRALRPPANLRGRLNALVFVPGSMRLAAAVGNGVTVIDLVPAFNGFDTARFRPLRMPAEVQHLAISRDGSTLAAASSNHVGIWDLTTFDTIYDPAPFTAPGVEIRAIALSPFGTRLGLGRSDRRASVHEVSSGKSDPGLPAHADPVEQVRFSPDGRDFLTLDAGGVLRLFDVSTGLALPGPSTEMAEAVIAASRAMENLRAGQITGTGVSVTLPGNQRNTLVLTHLGERAPEFYRDRLLHGGFVTALALSPDERLLVSAADDGAVQVWDTLTGLRLYEFGHSPQTHVTFVGADFAPDGRHVVSWDNNGLRRVWALRPVSGDPFHAACQRLPYRNGAHDMAGGQGGADPCAQVALRPLWSLAAFFEQR